MLRPASIHNESHHGQAVPWAVRHRDAVHGPLHMRGQSKVHIVFPALQQ